MRQWTGRSAIGYWLSANSYGFRPTSDFRPPASGSSCRLRPIADSGDCVNDHTRDRRSRHTFWIDDRIVDTFGPVMGRYPFGATALAVYAVLARRADRDGDSWPSLALIADDSGTSTSTVKRALRLLELLELVEISVCYEQGSHRQTSHVYTLLTPPDPLPEIEPDPRKWPPANRRTLLVRSGNRSESITAARSAQRTCSARSRRGERPLGAGLAQPDEPPPVQANRLPPSTLTASPGQADRLPPFSLTPQEGNTPEGTTRKERSPQRERNATTFVIDEIGLSNRQVWAACLGELARRGEVGRTELESWLRPAALIGREGPTLIIGAPNGVTRDRIATRLLP